MSIDFIDARAEIAMVERVIASASEAAGASVPGVVSLLVGALASVCARCASSDAMFDVAIRGLTLAQNVLRDRRAGVTAPRPGGAS